MSSIKNASKTFWKTSKTKFHHTFRRKNKTEKFKYDESSFPHISLLLTSWHMRRHPLSRCASSYFCMSRQFGDVCQQAFSQVTDCLSAEFLSVPLTSCSHSSSFKAALQTSSLFQWLTHAEAVALKGVVLNTAEPCMRRRLALCVLCKGPLCTLWKLLKGLAVCAARGTEQPSSQTNSNQMFLPWLLFNRVNLISHRLKNEFLISCTLVVGSCAAAYLCQIIIQQQRQLRTPVMVLVCLLQYPQASALHPWGNRKIR